VLVLLQRRGGCSCSCGPSSSSSTSVSICTDRPELITNMVVAISTKTTSTDSYKAVLRVDDPEKVE
jgi:hypothetical protein